MTWNLVVVKPLPKPKIDRNNTYVLCNGKVLKPGNYTVMKGSKGKLVATVDIVSGEGDIYIQWYDVKNRRQIFGKKAYAVVGSRIKIEFPYTFNNSVSLKLITYYYDRNGRLVRYDEYGC